MAATKLVVTNEEIRAFRSLLLDECPHDKSGYAPKEDCSTCFFEAATEFATAQYDKGENDAKQEFLEHIEPLLFDCPRCGSRMRVANGK